jgi:acetyl-CoA C-acetyltransferase
MKNIEGMIMSAVIVAAKRSPVGSFGGSLASLSAVEIATQVVQDCLKSINLAPELVDELIAGQVLTAGCGQNPARQTSLAAGLSQQCASLTINKVCGSGLKAVALAAQAIDNGDAEIIIAGGQESMSNAPHVLPNSRKGQRMGNWNLVDTMVNDGLWDAFNDYHMGITAENLVAAHAEQTLDREAQDQFALASHQRAAAAQTAGWFDKEITPISITPRRGPSVEVSLDDGIKADANIESLTRLRPAFDKNGSVTAGNASSLNDGAAFVVVMSEAKAKSLGLPILAHISAHASAGVAPEIMGTGPIPATRKVLEKANWQLEEVDLIEANEAFAVQALCVSQSLGLDPSKVNIGGGAIALGHPIGASGCRVLVTLLHHLERTQQKRGIATLCIGGGQGVAMAVERP